MLCTLGMVIVVIGVVPWASLKNTVVVELDDKVTVKPEVIFPKASLY